MVNSKSLKLLSYLQNQDDWTTALQLSLKLNVSLRSVKNYISEIKKVNNNLIISSRNGYKVNKPEVQRFLKMSDSLIPQTPEERIDYIIIKLINNTEKIIDIYDLSQEIYISEATLKGDLNKVKKKCYKFDLTLYIKGNNISLDGLEKNKRKIMNSILYEKLNENPLDINTIQAAFVDYDIEEIESIIVNAFKKYHYFINGYSLMNLVLHITITIDRIKNNNIYDYTEASKELLIKNHEYGIAQEIVKKLQDVFDINYNENEIYELTLLIISNATNVDYKDVNKINLEQFVGKECMNIVNDLIKEINTQYYIDFNEPEFLVRFALHIKNLLTRIKSRNFSKNPLTDSIKSNCPLIYDCAVTISYKIKNYTNCEINEDEIAYIALHIGANLVNQKNMHTKITCAILFPKHYDLDIKLAESIASAFGDSLLVKNIVTKEKELEDLQVDFVISTIKFVNFKSFPFIIVNTFLTEKDRKLIANKIEEVKKNKQKSEFLENLHSIFNESLFFKDKYFENENQAIEFMCDEMQKKGYIKPDFKQEVFEREAMSSTAFNGIAIPHSMHMNAIKTGMFTLVNKKPLNWGNQQVSIIFLLTINKSERKVFNDMFDALTNILSDEINLDKLIRCNSFEEFINMLVECI
ncbi:lichenan operon transcriptional antiterminator [Clostridium saccharoperbutylacetonicum]|uniref:Putative licABCH operon regulator n=1 Tax=Clostridium saccharoperbutylacetonicum N1-4(HMT) TaxID=931276 RepID=M1MC76_9CLOT|nr:BglG family transcription antiterminator [Clostridium saccharoperbutylacetonicum]AGF55529.1 putative licABCH operon regulator [Clostridium saccharoperbutylacetonicum N1-4(HMT)]NRT63752.1 lichenan operon transcriptional antiterminator [Clostridium saccharoperbutylacetonicum]NSB27115.1 lichenan operon transcriptional antiterminator [Clostridium saccharoperbutylacetonicum]NSB40600.1 lichenan operon transcriptional antiterminator [Clostridium saccharoperbutylacetonicum]